MELALKYPQEIGLDVLGLPEVGAFRRLPGFAELVQKLGLVDYWKQYGWPDDCRPVGDGLQCGFATVMAAR